MIYEERGRIFAKLPMQSGTNGQGKSWQKMDVVIETEDVKYPKKLAVTFFNEKADQLVNLGNNDLVVVSFVADSREHNGRWYTNINGTAINAIVEGADNGAQSFKASEVPNYKEDENDLPF
jgi:hypothetical protein